MGNVQPLLLKTELGPRGGYRMHWRNHAGQVVIITSPPSTPLVEAIAHQRRRLERQLTGSRKP